MSENPRLDDPEVEPDDNDIEVPEPEGVPIPWEGDEEAGDDDSE